VEQYTGGKLEYNNNDNKNRNPN